LWPVGIMQRPVPDGSVSRLVCALLSLVMGAVDRAEDRPASGRKGTVKNGIREIFFNIFQCFFQNQIIFLKPIRERSLKTRILGDRRKKDESEKTEFE
jgi:hypothetical protein